MIYFSMQVAARFINIPADIIPPTTLIIIAKRFTVWIFFCPLSTKGDFLRSSTGRIFFEVLQALEKPLFWASIFIFQTWSSKVNSQWALSFIEGIILSDNCFIVYFNLWIVFKSWYSDKKQLFSNTNLNAFI